MKIVYWIVGVVVVLVGAFYALNAYIYNEKQGDGAVEGRYMDIESYVRNSISDISPVKEVLGGTFYVTALVTKDGKGTVSYEDGHNTYTADFAYSVDESGKPIITSFTVR